MAETEPAAFTGVIHVVEDDEAVRDALALMLRVRGFRVQAHASGPAFLGALPQAEAGAIITDVMMPQMSGLELLRELRARGVGWPAVVISGRAMPWMSEEARELSATVVLDKPFEPAELVALIEQVTRDAA